MTCTTDDGNRTPWAYTGTDTDDVPQYPLTPCNAVPMMVVWLTMAVSEALQDLGNGLDDQELQDLADSVGLTKNCVVAIRNLIKGNQQVSDAFTLVAQTFLTIGGDRLPRPYEPSACPGIDQIKLFAPVARGIVPQSEAESSKAVHRQR